MLCLMLVCSVTAAQAQSFTSLWKQYEEYVDDDKPQSAISILRKIQQQSLSRKRYGDMLSALLSEQTMWHSVSPDSATAAQERTMRQYDEWKEKDGVVATMLRLSLPDKLGTPQLDSLLASADAGRYTAGNGAKSYVPYVKSGIDSRYFNNDLLSLIALTTDQQRGLYDYYRSTGKRSAACVAGALLLEHTRSRALGDSLLNEYGDMPECGAVAVRQFDNLSGISTREQLEYIDNALQRWPKWKEIDQLKMQRNTLTCSSVNVEIVHRTVTTDEDVTVRLTDMRNIKGVRVTARRKARGEKTGFDLARDYEKAVAMPNEYDKISDSLSLGRLPLGRWIISISDTEGKVKANDLELTVTDLTVISQPLPQGKTRFVVANAVTGHAVGGATLHFQNGNNDRNARTVVTDSNGEAILLVKSLGRNMRATTSNDTAMNFSYYSHGSYSTGKKSSKTLTRLYTDRAIYRPGQTVRVSVIAFRKDVNEELSVVNGDTISVRLINAQNKTVEEKSVVTDAFGSASTDFDIPSGMRNGNWRIVAGGYSNYIRVEEYKRPTFEVTLTKPETAYKSGDTLEIKGVARQYNGMPVTGAKVVYDIKRTPQRWWRLNDTGTQTLLTDTVMTADDGSFMVRMPMALPVDGKAKYIPYYYNEVVTATVTSTAGESHAAELRMPLSNRETFLRADLQGSQLADSAMTVTYHRYNAAGTEIDGDVMLTLDGATIAAAKANEVYTLPRTIASGEHTLMAICGEDTLRNTFVAFRKSDTCPMKATHEWFYQSQTQWASATDSVWIQYGSSDNDVQVYYTVTANDSVISHGSRMISNENVTQTLTYRKEYGDGLAIALAWVKDGKLYSRTMKIARPLPDKTLKMEWTTFRDRVIPGQSEQWTVRITRPDGTAADAVMQAVLYDKSMDQLRKHTWRYADPRNLSVRSASWFMSYNGAYRMWLAQKLPSLDIKSLELSSLSSVYALYAWPEREIMTRDLAFSRKKMSTRATLSAARVMDDNGESELQEAVSVKAKQLKDTADEGNATYEEDATAGQETAVRSDFAETAFFLPAVKTDAKGLATMRFTLPESTTTWRFMALSHDKGMSVGTLSAEAVAQKELMVQPNMPRFLRKGDNGSIAATVANMTDERKDAKVRLTILDADTERKVMDYTQKISVEGNKTAVATFYINTDALAEGAYLCNITAVSGKHTDGEQHMLTVLSDEEQVTKTVAYTFTHPIDTLLRFGDMIPSDVQTAHMKVEYVDNPAWLLMETLPKMSSPETKNAVTLANALYANRLSASMKWSEETSSDVLNRLKALQRNDGGFAWYSGMESSVYITMEVVKTLSRLNMMLGKQADTKEMLDKAFAFMQQNADHAVAKMKDKHNGGHPYVSSLHLDWLYSLSIEGRDGGSSASYLTQYVVQETKNDDMKTKALAAIVLHKSGRKADARKFVESIVEHTVYRSDMGRYFDSPRATYSWCDYRIPTQTLVIEALTAVTPEQKTEVSQMRRWLLNSKRTQEWSNAVNTVNAVHAFLGNSLQVLTVYKGSQTLADRDVKPTEASVSIHKTSDVESWAATKITFQQKTASVETSQTGLSVKREVLKNGRSVADSDIHVGDRLTVRITVTADRDYDFVTVSDNRPACLEPVTPLSGYSRGAYRENLDTKTVLHYNTLAKGTHTIDVDYYVDRTGEYSAGTASAVCEYADEFRATAQSYDIKINKQQ